MAQDIPNPRAESRPSRQRCAFLARRVLYCPQEVFRTHPMVHEGGEDGFVGECGV